MGDLNILLVDDESDLLESMGEMMQELNREGISGNIFLASNGMEAIRIARKIKLAAVLTDLKMPLVDGLGLIEELRKIQNLNLPLFVLTGYSGKEFEEKFEKYKVAKIFKKPCADLKQMLREVLESVSILKNSD